MSDTERDPGWSEQYAETGGWPPPAEGQRRYGPGAPPGDSSTAAQEPDPTDPPGQRNDRGNGGYVRPGQWTGHTQPGQTADRATGGWPGGGQTQPAETGDQATGGYEAPGPWTQSSDPATGHGNEQAAGQGWQPGPAEQWAQPSDQAGRGYAQPGQVGWQAGPAEQWAQPSDQAGRGYAQPGQPAGGAAGQWGHPADQAGQWGRPADQADPGAYGQPSQAWAPGDPAYGRLGRQTPPPPRQQRPRRPWDGRPAPARRPGGTPVVTITLIAICVVIYLIQQANPGFTARYALIPFDVEHGQYARLITSAFLHASLLHLGTNMITLYIVGAPLERVLRPVRYLIVYVLSALGGSLFSVWLSPQFSIGVGASGAIFGLFGALVVLRRQVGAEAGGLAVLIGLNLVISFTLPNISWQAHIGGLITGVLVALALKGIDRASPRRPAG